MSGIPIPPSTREKNGLLSIYVFLLNCHLFRYRFSGVPIAITYSTIEKKRVS